MSTDWVSRTRDEGKTRACFKSHNWAWQNVWRTSTVVSLNWQVLPGSERLMSSQTHKQLFSWEKQSSKIRFKVQKYNGGCCDKRFHIEPSRTRYNVRIVSRRVWWSAWRKIHCFSRKPIPQENQPKISVPWHKILVLGDKTNGTLHQHYESRVLES